MWYRLGVFDVRMLANAARYRILRTTPTCWRGRVGAGRKWCGDRSNRKWRRKRSNSTAAAPNRTDERPGRATRDGKSSRRWNRLTRMTTRKKVNVLIFPFLYFPSFILPFFLDTTTHPCKRSIRPSVRRSLVIFEP